MRYIDFYVHAVPRAKQSFRYTANGGGYTDPGVKAWQAIVKREAFAAMYQRDKFSGPVAVDLEFHLPTKRRIDADNLSKGVLDALNGVVFDDDCQVMDLHITKIIEKPGCVRVQVRTMEA